MERNGINQRNVQSTPSSPQGARPSSFEVIGSAESLVGRVSREKKLFRFNFKTQNSFRFSPSKVSASIATMTLYATHHARCKKPLK